MVAEKLYRFITNGEGVFNAGKRLLPKNLVDEAWEARKWLPKPSLPDGDYRFYMTKKGRDKYLMTLKLVHEKYLSDIQCVEVDKNTVGQVVYKDEWQVVVSV